MTIEIKDNCIVKGFLDSHSNHLNYGMGIRSEGQTGLITLNKFSNASYRNYLYVIQISICL